MDSKEISKAIKKNIWPLLKNEGFSIFASRNAWRYNKDTIEVINFQSFNSFIAGLVGCTTFSISVNLGIYFNVIPNQHPNIEIKKKDGHLIPNECECLFRRSLLKGLSQEENSERHIWHIDEKGDNISSVMEDAKQILLLEGLKWFEKYSNIDSVLNTLLYENEDMRGTQGFGRIGSPKRNYAIGYIALSQEKYELAFESLGKTINSGCFKAVSDILLSDYEFVKGKISNK